MQAVYEIVKQLPKIMRFSGFFIVCLLHPQMDLRQHENGFFSNSLLLYKMDLDNNQCVALVATAAASDMSQVTKFQSKRIAFRDSEEENGKNLLWWIETFKATMPQNEVEHRWSQADLCRTHCSVLKQLNLLKKTDLLLLEKLSCNSSISEFILIIIFGVFNWNWKSISGGAFLTFRLFISYFSNPSIIQSVNFRS